MSTAKSRGRPQNQRLESVKSQLERETASLLAERTALEGNYNTKLDVKSQIKPIYTESATLTPIVHRQENNQRRTEEVVNRLQQIIKLCKQEKYLTEDEWKEVFKVENQVLSYLQRTGAEPELKITKPVEDTPHAERQRLPAANQTWGKHQAQSPQNPLLNKDTLEIIAELERKALSEIIHLQKERDSLKVERDQLAEQLSKLQSHGSKVGFTDGQRLIQENKLLREQNNALNVRLSTLNYGAPTIYRPEYGDDFVKEGLSGQQYNSQITVYQNELKRANVVINQLRSRLANVAGLEQLHQQGERIRRQTAELLQYKSRNAVGEDSAVIHELQERLEEEERGKAYFLEELKVFKQRYLELQEQNQQLKRERNGNTISAGANSPKGAKTLARGLAKKKSGFADYENTLNQIRQIIR